MYNPYGVSFMVQMLLIYGGPAVFALVAALRIRTIISGRDEACLPRRSGLLAVVPFVLTLVFYGGMIVALLLISPDKPPVEVVTPCLVAGCLLLMLSGKRGCTLWAGAAGFSSLAIACTMWAIHLENRDMLGENAGPVVVITAIALSCVFAAWRYLRVTKKSA